MCNLIWRSHGKSIGCIVDGCPPGVKIDTDMIQKDLDRRKPGTSRHVTQRRETDQVEILSGVFEGISTGAPICLQIKNIDQKSKIIQILQMLLDLVMLILPIKKNMGLETLGVVADKVLVRQLFVLAGNCKKNTS